MPAPLAINPGELHLLLHDEGCQNYSINNRKTRFSAAFFLADTVCFPKEKKYKETLKQLSFHKSTSKQYENMWPDSSLTVKLEMSVVSSGVRDVQGLRPCPEQLVPQLFDEQIPPMGRYFAGEWQKS